MKKLWFVLTTTLFISISLWINPVGAMAAPVTVYQHCSFDGYHVDLSEGRYDTSEFSELGIEEDDLSGIKVESGYIVTVYADPGFQGQEWQFLSNDSCFVDRGLNDVVSSIQVEKLAPFVPTPPAPEDYVVNPANQHAYALTEVLTWPNAEATAVAAGGHLVTLNDEAEQTWVLDTFGDQVEGGDISSFWIGFNNEGKEETLFYELCRGGGCAPAIWFTSNPQAYIADTYTWASGESVTFTNWDVHRTRFSVTGEPNNYWDIERYADMCTKPGFLCTATGLWNDRPDFWPTLKGIIELPAN
jgi:hypothetical protein